jgi:prepilin-type N-terminal cleavage/methylation domain-containing protein
MKAHPTQPSAGVTLTELLVVLVVISILSTIALPVYINHAQKARVSTAQLEVRNIAEAMQACGAIHGFYVPIQVLDDIADSSGVGGSTESDAIDLESGIFLIDPSLSVKNLDQQPSLDDTSADARVENMVENWEGPFLNAHRIFTADVNSVDPDLLSGSLQRLDHPLDPWGQPYRFYSPLGVVGSSALSVQTSVWRSTSFSNGVVTNSDDRFDLFAIVSFGPDAQPNFRSTGINNPDDIIYFFGKAVADRTETGFAP